jgi:hypothetical protein
MAAWDLLLHGRRGNGCGNGRTNYKGILEWLITPNTMQKCKFIPENKQKFRPDCMIVEEEEEITSFQPHQAD